MLAGTKKLIKDVTLGSLYAAISLTAVINFVYSVDIHPKRTKQVLDGLDGVKGTLHEILKDGEVSGSGENSNLAVLSGDLHELSEKYGNNVNPDRIRLESLSFQLNIMEKLYDPNQRDEQAYMVDSLSKIEEDVLELEKDFEDEGSSGIYLMFLMGLGAGFGCSSYRRLRNACDDQKEEDPEREALKEQVRDYLRKENGSDEI